MDIINCGEGGRAGTAISGLICAAHIICSRDWLIVVVSDIKKVVYCIFYFVGEDRWQ